MNSEIKQKLKEIAEEIAFSNSLRSPSMGRCVDVQKDESRPNIRVIKGRLQFIGKESGSVIDYQVKIHIDISVP